LSNFIANRTQPLQATFVHISDRVDISAKTIKELHAKLTVKEAWVFQSKQASKPSESYQLLYQTACTETAERNKSRSRQN